MIGGVIFEQPAGGGFGAAKRGASSLRSRAARSGVVGPPASLAAQRIRYAGKPFRLSGSDVNSPSG